MVNAWAAALQAIARLVQRHGYLLAIQNAFRLVLFVMISSIIAACFISMRKHTSPIPPLTRQAEVPHRNCKRPFWSIEY